MSAEDAIRQMAADWLEATRQGGEAGAAGYASFATEDAVFLAPNMEPLEGRAAIQEAMAGFTSLDAFQMTWNVSWVEVASDGDSALIRGEFEMSARDPDGNVIEDRGKYFDTLQRQPDGTWLARIACFHAGRFEVPPQHGIAEQQVRRDGPGLDPRRFQRRRHLHTCHPRLMRVDPA